MSKTYSFWEGISTPITWIRIRPRVGFQAQFPNRQEEVVPIPNPFRSTRVEMERAQRAAQADRDRQRERLRHQNEHQAQLKARREQEEAAKRSLAEAQAKLATMTIPEPEPIAESVEPKEVMFPGDLDHYAAMAAQLGMEFNPAEFIDVDALLVNYLHREEVPIYNYDIVDEFLKLRAKVAAETPEPARTSPVENIFWTLAGPTRTIWVWRPLNKDAKFERGGMPFRDGSSQPTEDGCIVRESYQEKIPEAVLAKAVKIKQEAPVPVEFYASHYEARRPDPFLMVRAIGGKRCFIIDHWEEPGFTLAPKRDAE